MKYTDCFRTKEVIWMVGEGEASVVSCREHRNFKSRVAESSIQTVRQVLITFSSVGIASVLSTANTFFHATKVM